MEKDMYLVRCGNSHPNISKTLLISLNFTPLIEGPANMLRMLYVLGTWLGVYSSHILQFASSTIVL